MATEKFKKGIGALAGAAMVATLSVAAPPMIALAQTPDAAQTTQTPQDQTQQNTQTPPADQTNQATEGTSSSDPGDNDVSFYVAKVGDTSYETLSEAIKAAGKTNGTVKLLSDVTVGSTSDIVYVTSKVTLDLNGHKITTDENAADLHPFDITVGGDLTVTDSAGTGSVSGAPAFVVVNDGRLTIENGKFSGAAYTKNNAKKTANTIIKVVTDPSSTARVSIKGGKFKLFDKTNQWKLILDQLPSDTTQRFWIEGGSFEQRDPANGDDNFATNNVRTFLTTGASSVKGEGNVYTVEHEAYGVTDADGANAYYATIKEAAEAANKIDNATVTLYESVTDHPSVSFTKKVTVTAASSDVTFNGVMRFNASESVVKGVHFVLDGEDLTFDDKGKKTAGLVQNVIVSNKANKVLLADNTFEIKSMTKGEVDFQLSSVWLENGATNTTIQNNTFIIGRTHNNSAVGINLVGGKNAIDGTLVDGNVITVPQDADGVKSGNSMFLVANGNTPETDVYGVTNLTVSNNTMDGTAAKSYGVSIGDVNGLKLNDNSFKGTYMGLSYSTWGATYAKDPATGNWIYNKLPAASAGIELNGNTFTDNTAAIYFNAQQLVNDKATSVLVTPADQFTYTGPLAIDVTDVSAYRGETKTSPIAPAGTAFVGWYKDAAFETPLATTDTTGAAYAKFVPKTDLYSFKGISLNVFTNNDGSDNYQKAGIRFSYTVTLPEDVNYRNTDSVWKFGIAEDNLAYFTRDKAPVKNDDGSLSSSFSINGITAKWYSRDYYVQFYIAYTTADGTKITVAESAVHHQSVEGLAKSVLSDATASEAQKSQAQGFLDAQSSSK